MQCLIGGTIPLSPHSIFCLKNRLKNTFFPNTNYKKRPPMKKNRRPSSKNMCSSSHLNDETLEIARPLANFEPDLWGDYFLNYTPLDEHTQSKMEQEANELKEVIRKELLGVIKDPKERLEFLDAIHRLGVEYHFEKEIEYNLQHFYKKLHSDQNSYDDDLHFISLRFRLLRQHGFYIPTEIFEKFKCENNGSFKDSLASDLQGIINLYEASHLRLEGEKILDEALAFSTTHLTSFVTQSNSSMANQNQIARALKVPLHKRNIRLESRHHLSVYESMSSHHKTLLRFAKLDFNLLQELHKLELRDFTRWSRSFNLAINLPNFARDRVVETYFWCLGAYHEPNYSNARMWLNKMYKIIILIDDIYDSYGTLDELVIFTEAMERWDKSCISQLPNYMRHFYEAILDIFNEIEQDLAREEQSHALYYLREQMIATCQGFLQQEKWSNEKIVPKYDEYVKNGILSSAYLYTFVASYLGLGQIAGKDACEWILHNSKAAKASCIFLRLFNDISSHKFEQSRDHVASAVECYMDEFGSSKEEAYKKIQLQMEEAWKDINEEIIIRPDIIPKSLLKPIINLSRILYDIYQIGEDGYTMGKFLQPKIAAILIDPIIL